MTAIGQKRTLPLERETTKACKKIRLYEELKTVNDELTFLTFAQKALLIIEKVDRSKASGDC